MASMLMMLIMTLMILASLPMDVATPLKPPRMIKRERKRYDRTRFSTLNCRTLLADETLDDLDATLTESGVSLCALQETRRDGFMSTTTDNFKIFWYGECSGHRGVGFAVHNKFVHLVTAVHGIPNSDGRLMTLSILLRDNKQPVTLICAYSPPNTASVQAREKFYSQLRGITTTSSWIMGDLNARVGRKVCDEDIEFGAEPCDTVGPWSLKNDIVPNANGDLLLDIASENNASHFRRRDSKRWTWRHPRYHTRAVLDHVFVPASHMRFVARSFVAPHTSVCTDHRLVVCEVSFHPRITKKVPSQQPKINKHALYDQTVQTAFQVEVSEILGTTDPEQLSSEELSNAIRSASLTAAHNVLPPLPKTKFPKDFSANTIQLINRKRELWRFFQKSGRRVTRSMRDEYRSMCRETKQAIRNDRNSTLEKEAMELADAFAQNRFNGYRLLKRQHRTRTKAILPPETEFTKHYRAHYQAGSEEPLEVASCDLPPLPADDILTCEDFNTGVQTLNSNRQPGHDYCEPEYVKLGGPRLLHWTYTLMLRIWTFVCVLPAVDRIGCLIPIPKKSSSTSVDASRPICLLTTLYKLYAILVFQKVRERVREFVSWTQAGFIRGRSCSNNLWILRRVAERAIEFKIPVYCALVDYKGAFDALNRTTLGRVLALFLPPSMVCRVLSLYFDAKAMVMVNRTVGPEFELHRGVRQGCPASPSFFTVALAFISWSFRITFEGIKLIHLHLSSLEYADDQILFTLTANGLQSMLDFIVTNSTPFGLALSPKKCELICFHRTGSIDKGALPQVLVAGKVLPWRSSVVYLGSRISEDGKTIAAVKHRICCAESVVKRLNDRVFCRRTVSDRLKGHFIDTAVFASLLYGLEHCAFSVRDQRCLDGFFLRLSKRVMHLRYDYHLSYLEAEERLGVSRPSHRLASERLRWTGHMLRSNDDVLYEVLMFTPEGGARGRGRPRLRYYDTIKADLAERNINLNARNQEEFWSALATKAADRQDWQNSVVNWRR